MSWKHFQREEFDCACCRENFIEESFVDLLDELREMVGFPLIVTSGYRCAQHNARVSSTGRHGPHTTGEAVDLAVDRVRAYAVLAAALQMGFTGIGIKQRGEGRFIHLDMLDNEPGRLRPTVWSYP